MIYFGLSELLAFFPFFVAVVVSCGGDHSELGGDGEEGHGGVEDLVEFVLS